MLINEAEVALEAVALLGRLMAAAGARVLRARQGDPRKRTAQLVYWEIAYNALVVDLSRHLMPVRLLATRHEWDRSGTAELITALVPAPDVAMIEGPYLEMDITKRLIEERTANLIRTRFTGEDREVLKKLSDRFREAESALRKHLFTKEQQDRIAKAWDESQPADPKPLSPLDRVSSAATVVPVWVVFLLPGWVVYDRLVSYLEANTRRRFRRRWRW